MPPVAGKPPTKPMIEFEDDCFSRLYDEIESDCKRCVVSPQCRMEMKKPGEEEPEKETQQEKSAEGAESETEKTKEESSGSGSEFSEDKEKTDARPVENLDSVIESIATKVLRDEREKDNMEQKTEQEQEQVTEKKGEPMKKVKELAKATGPKAKRELPPTSSANPFRNATGGWAAYEAVAKIHGKFTFEEAVTQFHMFCKDSKIKVEDSKGRMAKTLATLIKSKLAVKDKDSKYELVKASE